MIRAVAKAEPEGTKWGSPAATAVATQEEELHACSGVEGWGTGEVGRCQKLLLHFSSDCPGMPLTPLSTATFPTALQLTAASQTHQALLYCTARVPRKPRPFSSICVAPINSYSSSKHWLTKNHTWNTSCILKHGVSIPSSSPRTHSSGSDGSRCSWPLHCLRGVGSLKLRVFLLQT